MAQRSDRTKRVDGGAPTIAVIGCGAIAESFHLPALARHRAALKKAILVDHNIERARELAHKYEIEKVAVNYHDVLREVDGAIVAVPHHLHHPISLDCIKTGVHVFCEKPLAETIDQVNEIVNEAESSGVTVCVNNNRRIFPSFRKVQQLITAGEIGRLQHLEIYHGEKFDWPTVTASYFGCQSSGKGVLLDTGAHILDLVCWWLGGKPQVISYADDSFGGAEAVARLLFQYGNCSGEVHLSWLSKLKNVYRIHGESAILEVGIYDWQAVTLLSRDGKARRIRTNSAVRTFADLANVLLDNFLDVVRYGHEPLVTARDVASSIELIGECYTARSRLDLPWHDSYERITHDS